MGRNKRRSNDQTDEPGQALSLEDLIEIDRTSENDFGFIPDDSSIIQIPPIEERISAFMKENYDIGDELEFDPSDPMLEQLGRYLWKEFNYKTYFPKNLYSQLSSVRMQLGEGKDITDIALLIYVLNHEMEIISHDSRLRSKLDGGRRSSPTIDRYLIKIASLEHILKKYFKRKSHIYHKVLLSQIKNLENIKVKNNTSLVNLASSYRQLYSRFSGEVESLEKAIEYLERSRKRGNNTPKNLGALSGNYLEMSKCFEQRSEVKYFEFLIKSINYSDLAIKKDGNNKGHHYGHGAGILKVITRLSRRFFDWTLLEKLPGLEGDFYLELQEAVDSNSSAVRKRFLAKYSREAYNCFATAIDKGKWDDEIRGYLSFQGRCELFEGKLMGNYGILKRGIRKLEDVVERELFEREDSKSKKSLRLDLGNMYSELGEAYQLCGRLLNNQQERIPDLINSIKYYNKSLERGKSEIEIIGHLGFSWFKLSQLISESEDQKGYVNEILSFTNSEDINSNLEKICFEESLKCSECAKDLGDNAKELNSKIGHACFELAVIEYRSGNSDLAKKHIIKAQETLEESMDQEFPYAYVLMARLSDFVKDELDNELTENLDPSEEEIFDKIKGYGWKEAVPKILDLEGKGKVKLTRYHKGTSEVYILTDSVFPIKHSFIVKSYQDKENAELEFLMTRRIFRALKGTTKYSRPLSLMEHNNRYFMVIERNQGEDLGIVLRNKDEDEKTEELELILDRLIEFHRLTTKRFSETKFLLEDEEKKIKSYHIDELDYLENLIERAFVKDYNSSDNKSRIEEIREIILSKNKEKFEGLDKRKYFRTRIPFTEQTYDFLVKYNLFIQKTVDKLPSDSILHCDVHVNNIIEGGIIIDSKKLKRGNEHFDISHLLLHTYFSYLTEDQKFNLLFNLYSGKNEKDNEQITHEFQVNSLHNSICLLGAMLNQNNHEEAKYYLKESIKLFLDLDEKELLDSFAKMINSTGRQDLMKIVNLEMESLTNVDNEIATIQLKDDGKSHEQNYKLKIGIDFDGVIMDSTHLKIKDFKDNYGITLTPGDCTKRKAMENGLTEKQYKETIKRIYATEKMLKARLVPGVASKIKDLINMGHEVYIITSRSDDEVKFIYPCLEKAKIYPTEVIYTNEKSKRDYCQKVGIDLFIDDSIEKLDDLHGIGTELYLFSNPTNQDIVLRDDLHRIRSWNELHTIVNSCSERKNNN